MNKVWPFLVSLSLLLGLCATLATTRINATEGGTISSTCGISVNTENNQQTLLHNCYFKSYGWPIRFVNSGVNVVLANFHTANALDQSDAHTVTSFTSFSRARIAGDWLFWSVVAGIILWALTNNMLPNPVGSKRKNKSSK